MCVSKNILINVAYFLLCTGYWETFDGSQIRELDASTSGSVNALDISKDGEYFVTGGDDKLIKVILVGM